MTDFRVKPALTDYARTRSRIPCNASSPCRAHGCLTQVMARASAVTRRADEDVSQPVESREITRMIASKTGAPTSPEASAVVAIPSSAPRMRAGVQRHSDSVSASPKGTCMRRS